MTASGPGEQVPLQARADGHQRRPPRTAGLQDATQRSMEITESPGQRALGLRALGLGLGALGMGALSLRA